MAKALTLAAWTLIVLAPCASVAGVRDDLRACQYGFWKTLKAGAPPPATRNRDEQYCLALAYWFQPSPIARDPVRARQWHAAAVQQGHVGAMVALAYMYEQGHGGDRDPSKAVALYRRAAELGSPDGMFNLFRAYTTGRGVGRPDAAQARAWLDQAAAAGSLDAKKELARIAPGEYDQRGGDLAVAAFAAYGRKDYVTSAQLYRQAADLGHTNAMVALGVHYRQGLGVGQDLTVAVRWFRAAAERGDPAGQAQLGFAYEDGEGVPENWGEMRRWCEKSAAQIHQLGLNCVGRLYQFGMAVPMNREKARVWFERAADQDNPFARWFAIYLRNPQNCTGFRSAKERERFFGVCIDPTGITFPSSKERNRWLAQRYAELEAQAFAQWGASGGTNAACTATGGQWSGMGCYTPAGHPYDPYRGR
jgi:TPR repeat protein